MNDLQDEFYDALQDVVLSALAQGVARTEINTALYGASADIDRNLIEN